MEAFVFTLGAVKRFAVWQARVPAFRPYDKVFHVMKNLLLLLTFFSISFGLTGCDGLAANTIARPDAVTTSSGLSYFITEKGTGPLAKEGDMVSVHYTG